MRRRCSATMRCAGGGDCTPAWWYVVVVFLDQARRRVQVWNSSGGGHSVGPRAELRHRPAPAEQWTHLPSPPVLCALKTCFGTLDGASVEGPDSVDVHV